MNKICPNNFFCFDKNTFILFIIFLIVFITYKINDYNNTIKNKDNLLLNKILENTNLKSKIDLNIEQINNLKNVKKNILNNYYNNNNNYTSKPPLRDPVHKIPININTRGEVPNFQQVGIIFQEGDDSSKKILPIYGRPTYIGSNHWLYYTTNDNYNAVKLPIEFNNKNCLDEYGCKELYNGENISVKGYINSFKVELYKFNKPRYIPYIIT